MTTYFNEKTTSDLLRKDTRDTMLSGWPRRLLIAALATLAGMAFLYVGVAFGYTAYLNKSIADTTTELTELGAKVDSQTQQKFISFYSQIINLKRLLAGHINTSNVFALLEETAHPSVSYQSAEFDSARNTLTVSGIAVSYEALASQLALISQDPRIASAVIEDSSTTSRGVQFSINVILKHEIFKF